MLTKNILTYSFVSQLWYEENKTPSDLFIPLILNLFRDELDSKIHKTNSNILKQKFENTYGIKIPLLALLNMLNRAKKQNLIIDDDDYFTLNMYEFHKQKFNMNLPSLENRINSLLKHIQQFLKNNYQVDKDIKFIEISLLDFLTINGVNIIDKYVHNKITEFLTKDNFHIKLADYVTSIEDDKELKTLCDLFLGNTLCDTLQIDFDQNYVNGETENLLDKCFVYLDTPIMIPLLDITDIRYSTAYLEFIEILKISGATIKIFKHVVEEIQAIISNAIYWVKKDNFDISKASRLTIYFRENQDQIPQLIYLNDNLEKKILIDLNIEIEEFDYSSNPEHLIDTKKLEKILLEVYRDNNLEDYFDEMRYSVPIATDVKSISAINILREFIYPEKMSDCTHFLVSKNWGLVSATHKYSKDKSFEDLRKTVFIDNYLCGMLWHINKKDVVDNFLKNKLLSDCISILSPTKIFYKNYNNAVKIYTKKFNIGEDEHKNLIIEKEIYNDVYKRCGNDNECILETISEIKKRFAAKVKRPVLEKNKELITSVENKNKTINQLQEQVSKQDGEINKLQNNIGDKNIEIENMNHKIFLIDNKYRINIKFCFQPCFVIELVIFISGIIGTIFSTWAVPLIFLPLVLIRFNRKLGYKSKKEISYRMLNEKFNIEKE